MKYLKIFVDFAVDMQELGDAERGRLFTAMLQYAETGNDPELRGNERFVWGTAKRNIDNQRKVYEARCEVNKRIATNRYQKTPESTIEHETCQDKDKDKDKKIKKHTPYIPPKGEWESLIHESVRETFNEFVANRKTLKKPMTDRAKVMLANRLNELSSDPQRQIRMLNNAIMNGWQSVYPLDERRKGNDYIQKSYNDDELLRMAVDLDG